MSHWLASPSWVTSASPVLALSAGEAWVAVIVLVVVGLLLSLVLTWAVQSLSGTRDAPDPSRPPPGSYGSRPLVLGFPVVNPKSNGAGRTKPPPLPPDGAGRRTDPEDWRD